MTLTQILQKIRSAFYTKLEIDSMGTSLSSTLNSKANNSDVVHKSGDETISGNKTFNDNLVANNGKNGAFSIATSPTGCASLKSFASDGTIGAFLDLCNKNDSGGISEWKGAFRLSTSQWEVDLSGFTDGSLRWCNKNIECVEEQGANYIRYTSGLQICFGVAIPGRDNAFPKAFKSGTIPDINITHYTSNHLPYSATVEHGLGGATTNTTFNFLLWSLSGGTYTDYECHYIAIGYWK